MARYILWDRQSSVITPSGEIFTAQQWHDRYPSAQVIDFVMSGEEMPMGYVSGALMQSYISMKNMYAQAGCDFTSIIDGQPVLDAIEAFEDAQAAAEEAARQEQAEAEAEAVERSMLDTQRIADALEDLVVLNMPDAEVE